MTALCRIATAAVALVVSMQAAQAGSTSYQVVQRDEFGVAVLRFSGPETASTEHRVEARLLSGERIVFGWRPAGRVNQAGWTASVERVPAGGPYTIELRCDAWEDARKFTHILVGDLWVLAGQSNMEGYGYLEDVQPPDERIHVFRMDDEWAIAREPLHTTVSATDPAHWPRDREGRPVRITGKRLAEYAANRKRGAGLGLPFAVQMLKGTGVPIGLIPCAHGGTRMDQWDPALKAQGGASLYGSMIRRVQAAGGRVKGILWYQGESDAQPERWESYEQKLTTFVQSVRNDLSAPDLPFLLVQIGRNIATHVPHQKEWAAVQEIQRTLPLRTPHMASTASIDLELEDDVHADTPSLKRLGRRLARLALGGQGPQPESAVWEDGAVRIGFRGVNGRLESAGRPAGFTLHGPDGEVLPVVSKTILPAADGGSVLLRVQGSLPAGAFVRYAWGRNPYCNITDSADMPVPAFGPLPVQHLP